ncbi:redoxin domain-containing protein [Bacillus benzoevorans]|uniref:Peroxiredoxin n=1 Tax=Bacillus benzoevorans TaxID=1456 RepID=A0A7X0LYF5_9BACI|nr:peroxiredoxin [Bacillus benzoevorans]
MIKKVIAGVLLFGLLAVAIVQAMEKEEKPDNLPGLRIGVKAPDFELENLSGEKVKLSDYRGKKVILNFWATWCPPCKEEMPAMEKFYQKAGDDVEILAVNIDPQYNVQEFIDKMGITFPILLDKNDKVNSAYLIMTIPTTYFINEDGLITNKYLTSMTEDIMKEYIDAM